MLLEKWAESHSFAAWLRAEIRAWVNIFLSSIFVGDSFVNLKSLKREFELLRRFITPIWASSLSYGHDNRLWF